MIVSVTGGSGFLGCHIVSQLVSAASDLGISTIRVLDVKPFEAVGSRPGDPQQLEPQQLDAQNASHSVDVTFIHTDITEAEQVKAAVRGSAFVVHVASAIDWGNSPRELLFNVNVLGTVNVLRAMHGDPAARGIVYTSTLDTVVRAAGNFGDSEADCPYVHVGTEGVVDALAAAVSAPASSSSSSSLDGGALFRQLYRESRCASGDAKPTYDGPYALSKTVAEQVVLRNGQRLPCVVLRPMGLFGPRDSTHLPAVFSAALSSKSRLFPGNKSNPAKFTHAYVENVAHVHVCALRKLAAGDAQVSGQVFFAMDDHPPSNFCQFMAPFLAAKGYVVPDTFVPEAVMAALAWMMVAGKRLLHVLTFGWASKHVLLTPEAVKAVCTTQTFDGSKARRLLGYRPVVDNATAQQRTVTAFASDPRFPQGPLKYKQGADGQYVVVGGGGGGGGGTTRLWLLAAVVVAVVAAAFAGAFSFEARVPPQVVAPSPTQVQDVCAVLRSVDSYGQWNTFTTRVATAEPGSGLVPGRPAALDVTLQVPVFGQVHLRDLPFVVLTNDDGDDGSCTVCWAYHMVRPALQPFTLRTRRCMVAAPSNAGVTVAHSDANTGPLAPLVRLLFKGAIERGFRTFNVDLKAHIAARGDTELALDTAIE